MTEYIQFGESEIEVFPFVFPHKKLVLNFELTINWNS